jgi:hypothetical protein
MMIKLPMGGYKKRGGKIPHILDLGARWMRAARLHAGHIIPGTP